MPFQDILAVSEILSYSDNYCHFQYIIVVIIIIVYYCKYCHLIIVISEYSGKIVIDQYMIYV